MKSQLRKGICCEAAFVLEIGTKEKLIAMAAINLNGRKILSLPF